MKNLKGQKKNRIQIKLHKRISVHKSWVEGVCHRIAQILDLNKVEVSVFLTDDNTLQELNRTYRNKDKPTDVLSFPIKEKVGQWFILGDIVISVETAKRQAVCAGHSLQEELKRLLVHGFIHLMGYDHELGGEEERKFFSLEEYVLKNLLEYT
jgi:probable rRNA maturation factor